MDEKVPAGMGEGPKDGDSGADFRANPVPALVIVLVFCIPLIVYMRIVPLLPEQIPFWIGTKENWDFFAFYRSRWLILLAGAIGWTFLGKRGKEPWSWHVYPLACYGFLAIASTLFSDSPGLALQGSPDRCEGTLVLVSYALLASICLQEGKSPRFVRWLFGAVLAGASVISLLGLCQFAGHDLLRTSWGRHLIVPSRFPAFADGIGFLSGKSWVYGLMPNPNYMGSYSGMIMVLTFGLFWFGRDWRRWAVLPMHFLVGVSWLGCRSKAGVLGGLLGMSALAIFGRRRWRDNGKGILTLVVGYSLLVFCMDYHTLKLGDANRLLDNFAAERISHEQGAPSDLQNLVLGTDSFDLIHASNQIRCEVGKDGAFEFFNRKGEKVPYEWRGQTLLFPPGEFRGFLVKVATASKVVQVTREETVLNLQLNEQGFMLLDGLLRPHKLRAIRRWGFEGRQRWGNGRGFIWSRSLPLLWDALFLGFGPDMFLYHFPQDDFVAKIQSGYPIAWLVDKPHNMYLQIGINTGGVSLLALLILFGGYLWQSAKLYWHASFDAFPEVAGVTLAATVGAYLAAGIFNDSVVAVAPIFWCCLGAGIGLNQQSARRSRKMEPVGLA
ncbi:MAG: O-antigen ligase family protein [Candidatus Riflebacteria bacterium]|nr:O-antigen ligase family protein [Candidatus Riflebacteria bacterium]